MYLCLPTEKCVNRLAFRVDGGENTHANTHSRTFGVLCLAPFRAQREKYRLVAVAIRARQQDSHFGVVGQALLLFIALQYDTPHPRVYIYFFCVTAAG